MNITVILDGIVSHALTLGLFERVNQHEPKSAPGNGLTAAVWAETIGPDPSSSGLASTSGVVTFLVRVYTSMLAEPLDAIDPLMLGAVDELMTAYSGDFTLNGAARCVDILGQAGPALSAKAGYLNQDNKIYRVMTISLPVIVNDVWSQNP